MYLTHKKVCWKIYNDIPENYVNEFIKSDDIKPYDEYIGYVREYYSNSKVLVVDNKDKCYIVDIEKLTIIGY